MGRIIVNSLCISLLIIFLGIYVGWHAHIDNPFGVHIYTPNDWCVGKNHSFTVNYLFVLIAGSFFLFATASLSVIMYFVKSMANRKAILRSVAASCLLSLLLISLGAYIHIPFEARYPIQISQDCVNNAS